MLAVDSIPAWHSLRGIPSCATAALRLPHRGYSGSEGANVRASILAGLDERVRMSSAHAQIAAENPDALDAIIAVFAAIAVADGTVVGFNTPCVDGFIAVAE
jgi:hypothetical protein